MEATAYRYNMGRLPTTYQYNMVYPRRTGTSWVRRRATMYRYNVGRPMLYRNLSTMYRYNMGRKTNDRFEISTNLVIEYIRLVG